MAVCALQEPSARRLSTWSGVGSTTSVATSGHGRATYRALWQAHGPRHVTHSLRPTLVSTLPRPCATAPW